MAGRPLMLATLLGASIGVPYVVSQTTAQVRTRRSDARGPENCLANVGFRDDATTPPPPLLSSSNAPPYAAAPPTYPSTATPAAMTGLARPSPAQTMRYHSIQGSAPLRCIEGVGLPELGSQIDRAGRIRNFSASECRW